jgi:hypothetical protein
MRMDVLFRRDQEEEAATKVGEGDLHGKIALPDQTPSTLPTREQPSAHGGASFLPPRNNTVIRTPVSEKDKVY